VNAEDAVAATAASYDNADGDLARAAILRLRYRIARSGKVCDRCKTSQPLSAFGRDSRERDSLMRICRSCKRLVSAATYQRRITS
jgi:hypothetical protein